MFQLTEGYVTTDIAFPVQLLHYLLLPLHKPLPEDLAELVRRLVLEDPEGPQKTDGGLLGLLLPGGY